MEDESGRGYLRCLAEGSSRLGGPCAICTRTPVEVWGPWEGSAAKDEEDVPLTGGAGQPSFLSAPIIIIIIIFFLPSSSSSSSWSWAVLSW